MSRTMKITAPNGLVIETILSDDCSISKYEMRHIEELIKTYNETVAKPQ